MLCAYGRSQELLERESDALINLASSSQKLLPIIASGLSEQLSIVQKVSLLLYAAIASESPSSCSHRRMSSNTGLRALSASSLTFFASASQHSGTKSCVASLRLLSAHVSAAPEVQEHAGVER